MKLIFFVLLTFFNDKSFCLSASQRRQMERMQNKNNGGKFNEQRQTVKREDGKNKPSEKTDANQLVVDQHLKYEDEILEGIFNDAVNYRQGDGSVDDDNDNDYGKSQSSLKEKKETETSTIRFVKVDKSVTIPPSISTTVKIRNHDKKGEEHWNGDLHSYTTISPSSQHSIWPTIKSSKQYGSGSESKFDNDRSEYTFQSADDDEIETYIDNSVDGESEFVSAPQFAASTDGKSQFSGESLSGFEQETNWAVSTMNAWSKINFNVLVWVIAVLFFTVSAVVTFTVLLTLFIIIYKFCIVSKQICTRISTCTDLS